MKLNVLQASNKNINSSTSNNLFSGLLIFRAVTRSREIHRNTTLLRNSVEILSNTCLYNIFETYFSYRGYLLAVNLQIYLGTSSLKHANNVLKLPGVDYVVKNWALAMLSKANAIGSFLERIVVERANDQTSVRKTLKMLVCSAQNYSIFGEICLEITTKSAIFYQLLFSEVCPEKS